MRPSNVMRPDRWIAHGSLLLVSCYIFDGTLNYVLLILNQPKRYDYHYRWDLFESLSKPSFKKIKYNHVAFHIKIYMADGKLSDTVAVASCYDKHSNVPVWNVLIKINVLAGAEQNFFFNMCYWDRRLHLPLTISSWVSVRMSRYWALGKFGEH